MQVTANGWYQATGCPYETLAGLFQTKSVKLVARAAGSPAWEALPLIDSCQGGVSSIILGLAVSESAHFECDSKILYGLFCLLAALPEKAASASMPSNEKHSFFRAGQFRAASLYHAIKPKGSEHSFTASIASLSCELRPFQVLYYFMQAG